MQVHYQKTKRPPEYKLKKTELVGIQPVQDIVELVIWTLFVAKERIVSLLLLADPESGKTELMKKYRSNKGIHVFRRFTAFGILRDLIKKKISLLFKQSKILGILMIFDLSDALNTLKFNAMEGVIRFLNALTEEGLSKESLYWTKGNLFKKLNGAKGGIITALTPSSFFNKNRKTKGFLHKGGWLSRFIVFSYSYSQEIRLRILESIKNQEYHFDRKFVDQINFNFPKHRADVKITKSNSQRIINIAKEVVKKHNEKLDVKLKGFRLQKSLISLAKASALRDRRKIVLKRDVDRISYLAQWMNLEMKELELDACMLSNREDSK